MDCLSIIARKNENGDYLEPPVEEYFAPLGPEMRRYRRQFPFVSTMIGKLRERLWFEV
jgi:hypothetical protein